MDAARAMQRALDLAERADIPVSPNPLVGCVIVAGDQVVGEGVTEPPGQRHAEIVALDEAGAAARGATAYVTLEPCAHMGRTPPCSDALIRAGVARVVIACDDPNPVAADGAAVLRAAGIAVHSGLLRDRAMRHHEVFLHGVDSGRPFVWLKSAVSLDGRVAAADGTSKWLTGVAARQHAHGLRARVDAIVVGSGTVLADDPQLTVRLDSCDGDQPLRVVLDGRARSPLTARVFDAEAPTVLCVAPDAHVTAHHEAKIDVVEIAMDATGRLDIAAVLDELWRRGVRSVLVEGGPTVTTAFVERDLYERVVVHVAPLLLGPAGRPAVFVAPTTLAAAPRLRLDHVEHVGGDAVLTLSRDQADPPSQDQE